MTESTFQGSTLGYDKQTTSLISQCYQYYHQFHQNKNCQHLCSRIPCSCHMRESILHHVSGMCISKCCSLCLMILKSSSGAGGKSVCTGISFHLAFPSPIPTDLGRTLSIPVFESRHEGCDTFQQLKRVVKFVDEHVKRW